MAGEAAVAGDEHPDTLNSIEKMGLLLKAMGRHEEALPYYEQALAASTARNA